MSSFHHSIIAAIVPSIVKKAVPFIAKKFKLRELDAPTRERITAGTYPWYYGALYTFWILALFCSGIAFSLFLGFFLWRSFPDLGFASIVWIALINMIGGWLVFGALIDVILWVISSADFRDYAMLQQMKSGSPYVAKDQFRALFVLGGLYYAIMLPVILLIFFLS